MQTGLGPGVLPLASLPAMGADSTMFPSPRVPPSEDMMRSETVSEPPPEPLLVTQPCAFLYCSESPTPTKPMSKTSSRDDAQSNLAEGVSANLAEVLLRLQASQTQHEQRVVDLMVQQKEALKDAVSDAMARFHGVPQATRAPVTAEAVPMQKRVTPPVDSRNSQALAPAIKLGPQASFAPNTFLATDGDQERTRRDSECSNAEDSIHNELRDQVTKLRSRRKRQSEAHNSKMPMGKTVSEETDLLELPTKKKSFHHRIDAIMENKESWKYNLDGGKHAMKKVHKGELSVDPSDFHGQVNCCLQKVYDVVYSDRFDMMIIVVICLNSLLIGAQTDHTAEFGRDSPGLKPFEAAEKGFLVVFTIELALRLFAEGRKFFMGPAKVAHSMDFIIVFSGWAEQLMMSVGGDALQENETLFGALRILRLLRLGRSARLMAFSEDLRALVQGLLYSFKSLIWCVIFLNILMFVYCVLVIEFTVDYFPGGKLYNIEMENSTNIKGDTQPHVGQLKELHWYFGNLPRGMLTLFRAISGGTDWGVIAEPLKNISWGMVMLFSVFIGVCIFAVLNVITCIFIENSKKLAARDKSTLIFEEVQERNWLAESLRSMFAKADTNDSGVLEWEEFEDHFSDPIVQAYFRRLGIDIESCGVRTLFEIFDFDKRNTVDLETFVIGTLHLQGNAKAIDLHRIRADMDDMQRHLKKMLEMQKKVLGAPKEEKL